MRKARNARGATLLPQIFEAEAGRKFNLAAEIRIYVRTLGPLLHLNNYRRYRAEVRQLGLGETEEAIEFARRHFTVDALTRASLPDHVDVRELARCAQGAVLLDRKLCFSEDVPLPNGFPKDAHPWFGYRLSGVGKRLALAFAKHFGVDSESLRLVSPRRLEPLAALPGIDEMHQPCRRWALV